MITKIVNLCKSLFATDTGPILTTPRSSDWSKVRDVHLSKEPACRACGTKKKLTVHHIIPYHIDKSKELDEDNLMTLCEEHHCHLVIGHLCSWYSYNPDVRKDVVTWLEKVKKRP
jgi:hypothetical protein